MDLHKGGRAIEERKNIPKIYTIPQRSDGFAAQTYQYLVIMRN